MPKKEKSKYILEFSDRFGMMVPDQYVKAVGMKTTTVGEIVTFDESCKKQFLQKYPQFQTIPYKVDWRYE